MGWCSVHHKPFIRWCGKCVGATAAGERNFATLNARYDALTGSNGRVLSQDAFGVCGLAACVYLLFKYNKTKARKLYEATFADAAGFRDGSGGPARFTVNGVRHHIPFSYVARRYFNMMGKKEDRPTFEAELVDFGMCRGLGYLLKKADPARYQTEKSVIWHHVDGGTSKKGRHALRMKGNLPLRTNTVAYILRDILGLHVSEIVHKQNNDYDPRFVGGMLGDPITYQEVADYDALQGRYADKSADLNWFGVAGVQHALFFSPGGTDLFAKRAPHPILEGLVPAPRGRETTMVRRAQLNQIESDKLVAGDPFTHWIVISSMQDKGDVVGLETFTLGSKQVFDVRKADFMRCIQDVIFGTKA